MIIWVYIHFPTHLQLMSDWVAVSIQVEDQSLLLCDGAGVSGCTTHTQTIFHLHTLHRRRISVRYRTAHLTTYSSIQKLFLACSPRIWLEGYFSIRQVDNTCTMLLTWQVSIDLTICAFWQESIEPARLRITHTADSSMNSDTCGGAQSRDLMWRRGLKPEPYCAQCMQTLIMISLINILSRKERELSVLPRLV